MPFGFPICFVSSLRQIFLCPEKHRHPEPSARGAGASLRPADASRPPAELSRPKAQVGAPVGHLSFWSCCHSRPAGLALHGTLVGSCLEIGFFRAVGPSIVLKAALCLMPMEAAMTPWPLLSDLGVGWGGWCHLRKTWACCSPCPDAASGGGRETCLGGCEPHPLAQPPCFDLQ